MPIVVFVSACAGIPREDGGVSAPDTAYLLTVVGGCSGLTHTHSIGITTHAGRGIVSSGLDEIRLEQDRCRIVEIRPLDYARMRAAEWAE